MSRARQLLPGRGRVKTHDTTRRSRFLQLQSHSVEQNPTATSEIKRVFDTGPVRYSRDYPLRHVPVERHGGVEEVGGGEEEADGGEGRDWAGEARCETGRGRVWEEMVEEVAGELEVEEEENGEGGEEYGVD